MEGMLVFTVREREDHKMGSGKNVATIEKTSERGLQFKNERYFNADTIKTMKAKDLLKPRSVITLLFGCQNLSSKISDLQTISLSDIDPS